MRSLRTLLLLTVLAAPLTAQTTARRVTITPTVGILSSTPLFEHEIRFERARLDLGSNPGTYEFRDIVRLRVEEPVMAGVRVAVPLGGRWAAQAAGAYGSSDFEFRVENTLSEDGELLTRDETFNRDEARIITLALAIARTFPLRGDATEAEAGLGGGLNHFQLAGTDCRPLPPSQGFGGVECNGVRLPSAPPYEESYSIPSAVGHLALRHRVTERIGIEGRGTYSVGRANTESFYRDLVPEFDDLEAPKRVTVHVAQLSLGVSIGL